ncbi:MAG TPA: transposase, partial [Candidatus Dormibacteraeota bacterium]|nr:transposase [Candidatus Dormibacteraeota bacterium]
NSGFVKYIKGISSHHLRIEFSSLVSRLPSLWTKSYFVSTVGGAPLSAYAAQRFASCCPTASMSVCRVVSAHHETTFRHK